MQYKSEEQKRALEKQGKFLQKFNEQSKIFKTEEAVQKAIKLYNEGLTTREIGKIFNCSKPPVEKLLRANGVIFRKSWDSPKARSRNQFGEKNHAWKGGIKSIYDRIRDLTSYWTWHHTILKRDSHTCQECGSKEDLQVHHMKTLKNLVLDYCKNKSVLPKDLTEQDLNSEIFYELSNGVTFCKKCHKDWHTENGR